MISFSGVSKSYGGKDLLSAASFRINSGERMGVVGPNGAGKSTLFGLITGEVYPDAGSLSMPSAARIGYLRQHLDETGLDRTIMEFVSDALRELRETSAEIAEIESALARSSTAALITRLGEAQTRFEILGGYRIHADAAAVLEGLGFDAEARGRPLRSFSGGWRMRAALARVLVANPDIMLLDEPSNYLDLPAVEWLRRFLDGFQGTLLLISHDRYLLNSLTTKTLEVNGGLATVYAGDYDYYRREREERLRHLSAAKKNQDRRKDQMERFIERFRSKNTKATLVKSQIKKLERMEDISLPEDLRFSGSIRIPPAPRSGVEVVSGAGLGLTYDGDRWIFRGVDITLNRGDKVAFVGYNGMGKTTMLRLLSKVLPPSAGTVKLGHKVVVGYQAQEFGEILPPDNTVHDVVRAAAPANYDTRNLRSVLASFGFAGADIDKPCSVLSGGEKIRLCFARIFINPPNLLIIDEPTTHLDIAAREALQEALDAYDGTLCVVSHDVEFIRAVAENIVAMEPDGPKRYHGGYDYYLEKVAARGRDVEPLFESEKNASDSRRQRRRKRSENRRELAQVKRRQTALVEKLEAEIQRIEKRRDELGMELSGGEVDDYAEINRELNELNAKIEKDTAAWEAAATELDRIETEYTRLLAE